MNLMVIRGPNFSGRTRRLRAWAGLPDDLEQDASYCNAAYVGPDPSSALSGIAPTVDAELELMAADRDALARARRAISDIGFGYCLPQNPFTLSGGEQAVLAVVAAVAGRPRRLAIDCTLEQLSAATRARLVAYLGEMDGEVMLADNRLEEWFDGPSEWMPAIDTAPTTNPEATLPLPLEHVELELVDLCHSYIKGRPVIQNLNFRIGATTTYTLKGPNGSGKTTLSKILCGLLKPSSGEIRRNGQVVCPWKSPGRFVSYHFQNPDLQLFQRSVAAELAHAKDADAALTSFGLAQLRDTHPLDLPFVMRKRLTLASSLCRQAGMLILDEPTLGQDDRSALTERSGVLNGRAGLVITHTRRFDNLPIIDLSETARP